MLILGSKTKVSKILCKVLLNMWIICVILALWIFMTLGLVLAYGKEQVSRIQSQQLPAIYSVPVANDYFVGREEELAILRNLLLQHSKVAIIATGGVGKTQLAKKFAEKYYRGYDIVWWFDANKNINDQFQSFADQIYQCGLSKNKDIDPSKISANAVISYVKNYLRYSDKKWLIIFDNTEEISALDEYLPTIYDAEYHHILFTSRNANTTLSHLKLQNFSQAEAIDFLIKATDIHDKISLTSLSKTLSNYPLALAQAAAYIKINNISISEYITVYNKAKSNALNRSSDFNNYRVKLFDLGEKTMENTLSLTLEKIAKESEAAISILNVGTIIDQSAIPEDLLQDIIKFMYDDVDGEKFKQAIVVLKKYSLIEDKEQAGRKVYDMHDFVKSFVKTDLVNDTNKFHIWQTALEKTSNAVLEVLCRYLDKPFGEMVEYVNSRSDIMAVAHNMAFNAYDNKISSDLLLKLMVCLLENNVTLLHRKGDYKLYQKVAEKARDIVLVKKNDVDEKLLSRFYFSSICADYIFASDASALDYENNLLKALEFSKKNSDEDIVFVNHTSVGVFMFFRGNIDKGLELLNKAFLMVQNIRNDYYKTIFYHDIAWLHMEKGEYEKASEYVNNFFDISNNLDNKYPLHLYAIYMKASVALKIGNIDKVLKYATTCYDEAYKFFQTDNSEVSYLALRTLTEYYQAKKDYNNAEKNIKKTIQIQIDQYGGIDIDPRQALSHMLLGNIYYQMKQYKKAYDAYMVAEKFYTKLYHNKFSEIYDVSILFADIAILGIKMDDNPLVKKYCGLLVDNFSFKNPNVKRIVAVLNADHKFLDHDDVKNLIKSNI